MRKHFLLLVVLTFCVSGIYAAPIDPSRAINVAEQFMPASASSSKIKGKQAPQQVSEIVYTHYMPQSGKPAIYVVNINGGFALISADDVAHPVLGYNYGKPWPTNVDSLAPSVKGFLDDLAAQMEAASEYPQDAETAAEWQQPRRSSSRAARRARNDNLPDSVGPLLTTTWDQGQYYNAMCPQDQDGPDGHVYTGCVATAMAQIIKYWGYPTHGRGAHAYNTSNLDPYSMCPMMNIEGYGTQFVDFSDATYDYEHMPDALTSRSSQEEIDAVSRLMYHCGVAINMFFGNEGSGAYSEDVRAALISYFGFTPSLGYADRQLYSDLAWEDSLRANINRGEPIFYTGKSIFASHAFVCDGYKQDGYFHYNFGWGGIADGWYLTKAIDADFGYSEWPSAIMGIRPDSASYAIICHKTIYVENRDSFIVTKPTDLFPLRGGSEYHAVNAMTGVTTNLTLIPEDSLGQLVLDILDFGKEQSVVIYDGINKDSILRVLETRRYDEWNRITNSRSWVYAGTPEDSILNNLASMDFSPILSTRHGLTIVVHSYGGFPEGFHLRVHNASDTNSINPEIENARYWKDIVNSEPNGFRLNGDTIKVTSNEDLAWVARYVDSLWIAGAEDGFYQKVLSIENDIDLDGYLWAPIRIWFGNINGNGHVIRNLKVSTLDRGGLFSILMANVSNLGFINARINAANVSGTLAGVAQSCVIQNCYSINYRVNAGNGAGGGIVGSISDRSQIINCYAYGDIYAPVGYGGIVGGIYNSEMHNCVSQLGETYSWANFHNPAEWRGLLSEEVHGGEFSNCFSDVSKALGPNIILSSNYAYLFLGDIYNVDAIENLSTFNIIEDTLGTLQMDTSVNFTISENVDVITALNKRVAEYNSPNYRTWVRDQISHMPVFGEFYEVTCPNVSNIYASNIPYNGDFAVALTWQENGEASEWQVKYNIKDAPESDAVTFITHATHDTIIGLFLGSEYCFSVRPVCSGGDTVGWGKPCNLFVDKMSWVDMVNDCPTGYLEKNGNVYISTPEALAWVAKYWGYREDTIFIMNNLDMGTYRWTCGNITNFRGTLEGNNHIISNLYCNDDLQNEDSEGTGLINRATNASFNNIIIQNGSFLGNRFVGSLVGYAENCIFNNCHAIDVVVKGISSIGGLGGLWVLCHVDNCSSTGSIYADLDEGGLIGTLNGEMYNCFARSIVYPLGVQTRMYYGGFIGTVSGTINNCYSAGRVEKGIHDATDDQGGLFIGHAAGVNGSNLYAQDVGYFSFFSRKEEEPLLSDTTRFDNIGALHSNILIEGTHYSDILSVLNAWVEAYNEDNKYRHWIADTANLNGGFPIFAEPYSKDSVKNDHKFLVVFVDQWGNELKRDSVEYGQAATPPDFNCIPGWMFVELSGSYSYITEDTYIVAYYSQIMEIYHTITFTNWDGSVLDSHQVLEGEIPEYREEEPSRYDGDGTFVYWFYCWSPEIVPATEDATYTAEYRKVYNVVFVNWDGDILNDSWIMEGFTPEYYDETPTKPETTDSTYTFAGWSPEVVPVTGEATYTATFTATYKPKYYTIIFVNWDAEELQRDTLEEGTLPVYIGETPTKEEDAENWYCFESWTPEIVPAMADATYTAVYRPVPKSGATGVDDVVNESVVPQKVIIDNNIFILRGDKVYTIQGQEVR